MTVEKAVSTARTLFPGKNVANVTPYTLAAWRDGGWKGWRVSLGDGTIHWMTRRGAHEKAHCCPEPEYVTVRRALKRAHKVEVVRR